MSAAQVSSRSVPVVRTVRPTPRRRPTIALVATVLGFTGLLTAAGFASGSETRDQPHAVVTPTPLTAASVPDSVPVAVAVPAATPVNVHCAVNPLTTCPGVMP